MDKKNIYLAVTAITIIILLIVVLSIAVTLKKTDRKSPPQQAIQQKTQQEKQQKQESANKEEIIPEDQIEFSDPGNDELGQEVKTLDSLINQTLPGEYNEEDLSSDKIENEAQLQ